MAFNNWPAFFDACQSGKKKVVQLLLNHEKTQAHIIAFINTQPSHPVNNSSPPRHLPLQIAIINGHLKVTQILLENGANPDIEDSDGNTIFSLACMHGQRKIINFLLDNWRIKFQDIFNDKEKTIMNQESYEKNWLRKKNNSNETAFILAIKKNLEKIINLLLKHDASKEIIQHQAEECFGEYHESPLSYCVRNKLPFSMRALTNHGVFLGAQDKYQRTSFWHTCALELYTPFEFFTETSPDESHKNFNPDWLTDKDSDNQSAFYIACANGHVRMIKRLLSFAEKYHPSRMLIKQRGYKDRTPLMATALSGSLNALKILIDNYPVNLNDVDTDNETTFSLACTNRNTDIMLYFFGRNGFNPEWLLRTNRFGKNPFYVACENGLETVVSHLFNRSETRQTIRTNINIQSSNGSTPLIAAISKGHITIARLLVQYFADPNIRDNQGNTAFFWACLNGILEFVKYFLYSEKINLDLKQLEKTNSSHNNAFFLACMNGHAHVVSFLLEDEKTSKIILKNINTRCENGDTSLIRAAQNKHIDIVEILLNNSAYPYTKNIHGNTFFSVACAAGALDIVELTWKRFENPEIRNYLLRLENNKGNSPFMLACASGHLEVVKRLLEWDGSIDLTKQNSEGKTAIELAQENKHMSVIEFLSNNEASHRMDIVSTHTSTFFRESSNDPTSKRSRSTPPVEIIESTSKQTRLG